MKKHTGLFFLLAGFLLLHLWIINDYGFTWDFHFHFFGGGKLLGIDPKLLEPRALPFVEPDPRSAWSLPYGPLMSIPPVASYLLLYRTWHLLPPDSAYHLPIIFWGAAGIGILYIFLTQAFVRRVAIIGAIFLALTPRYFGDLHNNMKDIPSAVAFALNMWLLWRIVTYKRAMDLLWAILAFALAFNVKINSIFIPVIFGAWTILQQKLTPNLRYFILAPVAAFGVWSIFWQHPIDQLLHAYRTFGIGTNNIEVLLNGAWYCSGSTVPWYYPYWYLLITTPLPILIFFGIGLCTKHASSKLLLLLWLFLPLTRYLIPSVGVIDGIRHFEEVLFPISAIAALGADALYRWIIHRIRGSKTKIRTLAILPILLSICVLIGINYAYHPYQITYVNELVGGVRGAFGTYDLDYWGTSQKAAVEWVNTHAPQNARVHIVMASAVAGQYLRPDLLTNLNTYSYDESDFVIFLNRQSFFYRFFYAYEYLLHHRPSHTVTVRGVPLTWIFDNRTDNRTPRQTPWWQGEDPCIIRYWRGERP